MAALCTEDLGYPEANVMTLNQRRGPTRDEVLNAVGGLVPNLRKEDLLIFYYSGHGIRVSNGMEFAFCTKGSYLLKAQLLDAIKDVQAKVVIVVDACHSGQFNTAKSKSKGPDDFDNDDLEAWFRSSGRLVMSAATAREEAPGTSAFTHAFIQAAKNLKAQKLAKGREKMTVKINTLFDELSDILEEKHKDDPDRPPPARISGVEALGSFSIGPF